MSKWKINFHWTRDRSMKYLLSILVLFSGLNFAETYLSCDSAYNHRITDIHVLKIRPSDKEADIFRYRSGSLSFSWKGYELRTTTTTYDFVNKRKLDLPSDFGRYPASYKLDRTSLDLTDEPSKVLYKCQIVSKSDFDKIISYLEKYAKKQRDKRKI